ncbi:hypothetical protein ACT3K8_002731 [Listeria monocytogenes]
MTGISLLCRRSPVLKGLFSGNRTTNAINKQKSQLDLEAYEKYHALLRESIRVAE